MSKRNPFDHPEWKAFEDHIRHDMIPKMRESATVLVIAPKVGKFDVQFAVEIGAAILLEKPLLVIMPTGGEPPPKLARIADRIIYTDGPGDERVPGEIQKFMNDFGRQ